MCGLVSFFGPDVSSRYNVSGLLGSLAHRGPDDRGIIEADHWALGHQRLSIMDVKGGHQPMQNPSKTLTSVCNGEIYNFRDLQSQHFASYPFNSGADSEVLLPLYQAFGTDTAQQLDGMFSFVVSTGEEWLAARDRIGIKPLYMGTTGDDVMFSSELKALVSCAENIREFPTGHYYHSKTGLKSYYHLPEEQSFISDLDTILPAIRESLANSVRKRMMSDVPVGDFLSGGLDSSLIAALMKQNTSQLHFLFCGLTPFPRLESRPSRLRAPGHHPP